MLYIFVQYQRGYFKKMFFFKLYNWNNPTLSLEPVIHGLKIHCFRKCLLSQLDQQISCFTECLELDESNF